MSSLTIFSKGQTLSQTQDRLSTVDDALQCAHALGRVELVNPIFGGREWECQINFTNRNGSRICAKATDVSPLLALVKCIHEALSLGAEPLP